jgi:hypothetical protein
MRCEKVRCMNSLDVCLDGVLWLCWDHYVEGMRKRQQLVIERETPKPGKK